MDAEADTLADAPALLALPTCQRTCDICLDLDFAEPLPNLGSQFMDDSALDSKIRYFLRYTTPELRQRSARGCDGCALLLEALLHFHHEWSGPETDGRIYHKSGAIDSVTFTSKKLDARTLQLYRPCEQPKLKRCTDVYGMFDCDCRPPPDRRSIQWPSIVNTAHTLPDSKAEACFEKIKKWIETCENDPDCALPHGSAMRVPSRLLNVSEAEVYLQSFPKNASLSIVPVRYCALSYCWGRRRTTVLTSQNIEKWERGTPTKDLPKTFKDAIVVTRKLGLNHLWIDSLCIVQDNPDDWNREAADMAQYYRDAYLTIAASCAADNAAGFLRTTRAYPIGNPQTEAGIPKSAIYVRLRPEHFTFFDNTEFGGYCPMLDRAWCFQERLLSTRILHYFPTEMLYECRNNQHCECDGINFPLFPDRTKYDFERALKVLIPTDIIEKSGLAAYADYADYGNMNRLYAWHQALAEYTKKKLTFQDDILPAISGVAKELHRPELGEYCAGLWKNRFAYGLLWYATRIGHRPTTYIAPTFSWASSIGPIRYRAYHDLDVCIDLIEVVCEPESTLNTFGKVARGHVTLCGPVWEAWVAAVDSGDRSVAKGHAQRSSQPIEDNESRYCVESNIRGIDYQASERGDSCVIFDTTEDRKDSFNQTIYCLVVATDITRARQILLLRKCEDGADQYKRVGIIDGFEDLPVSDIPKRTITIV